jgi:hypothetical protein
MNRRQRVYMRAHEIGWRIADSIANALVENIEESRGSANGDSEQPLAPLFGWDPDIAEFKCGPADRTPESPPLLDTGRLVNSIHVNPAGFSYLPGTMDGKPGFTLRIEIFAEDYGKDQARGGTFQDVFLGRTIKERRSRAWGDMDEGCDFIRKKSMNVVPRPWWQISRTRLKNIANAAIR